MSTETNASQFRLDAKNQYHFFEFVSDPGRFVDWYWPEREALRLEELAKQKEAAKRLGPDFLARFSIPRKFLPENCITVLGREGDYQEFGISVSFVDKATGLLVQQIDFAEVPQKEPPTKKEDLRYKPTAISFYSHSDVTLDHPFTGDGLPAIRMEERTVKVDSLFRVREKSNLRVLVVHFAEEWDPESLNVRRITSVFQESTYELARVQKAFPVRQIQLWSETMRTLFSADKLVIYHPDEHEKNMVPVSVGTRVVQPADMAKILGFEPKPLPGPEVMQF